MKSKVLVIGLVLIIVALLIILGITLFKKEPKDSTKDEILPTVAKEIWISAVHSNEGKRKVRYRIADIQLDLDRMSGKLDQALIDDYIRPFFIPKGTDGEDRPNRRYAVTHDGKLKMGQDFPDYLQDHLDVIEEIDFKLTWFVSEEYSAEPARDDDFHHFVQFGLKLTYVMNDKKVIDPPGGGGDYHIRECEWVNL